MRHWKEIGFRQSSAESEKNGTLQWYHKWSDCMQCLCIGLLRAIKTDTVNSDSKFEKAEKTGHYLRGLAEKVMWREWQFVIESNHFQYKKCSLFPKCSVFVTQGHYICRIDQSLITIDLLITEE
jgi:hypothetical protein